MSYSSFLNTLTTTTSKYTSNLRRTLLNSEADGDTEDDSHISRVLRAYYTEKGRPFPEWLPPDPKAPPPPQVVQSGYGQHQGGFVSSYGQPSGGQQQQGGGGRFGRGGLSDLWDGPGRQQQQPEEPGSLRARPGMRPSASSSSSIEQADSAGLAHYSTAPGSSLAARPLPSQRAGSYQSQFSNRPSVSDVSPPASSGSSASDRLKQRLWGTGRAGSPTPTGGGPSTPPPPAASNPYAPTGPSRNPYDAPAQPSRQSAPPTGRPVASGNASWSGGDDGYGGSGGGYGGGPYASGSGSGGGQTGGYGLPSGPRGGQRPSGLPSGPRMKR